ncbi:MAG: methionyl-tRNA formyltransferase [Idiomarina sp. T82-3]|uniref:methionyl-tRNA formyltransferase n=1 Tax=Idiomarina TaxID=135575 RepID=UPI00079C7948|nr:methionyl-tRNA formyltransferase [Idiomarina sp. T82-3]KXS34623.1 MAG: methionyl-tRNA formyltransferase [Idiomarina sp. T82-3]
MSTHRPLRIVFAGTPEFAADHLAALLNSDHEVVAVYTQPDRKAGRGKKLQPSAVKELALEHAIAVEQPEKLNTALAQQQLAEYRPDVMVVVAYGLLLPEPILTTPKYGCINVHGSLLPRWRGAAPIQRSIWAGDEASGVAVMQMEKGLDTGPVLHVERCAIDAQETSASLYKKLAQLGPRALVTTLDDIESYRERAEVQNHDAATYAKKLSKDEGKIDWSDATQLERNVRAFNPWPFAWFELPGGKPGQRTVKVHQASVSQTDQRSAPGTIIDCSPAGITVACSQGALTLHSLQLPGKKPLPVSDLLNGYATTFAIGVNLTNVD